MPFISVTTSKKLDQSQREALCAGLGKDISIIPGKSQANLMIDIFDGRFMCFSGEAKPCAYLAVHLYGPAPLEKKAEFTAALFGLMQEVCGLSPDDVYISYQEYPNWGSRGIFK